MTKVSITGVGGFIGSALAAALLRRGDYVIGIDNFHSLYLRSVRRDDLERRRANPNFELLEVDIRDPQQLATAFAETRPEVVVHAAALMGHSRSFEMPELYRQTNGEATRTVLEASRSVGVRRFVFLSSASVYGASCEPPFREDDELGDARSPYSEAKRFAEGVVREYAEGPGLDATVLRLFTTYGPGQRPETALHRFCSLLERGEPLPIYGDGSATRDYLFVDDCVHGIIKAIDASFHFEIINLASQRRTSVNELVDVLGEVMRIQPRRVNVPPPRGLAADFYADISKAQTLLRFRPKTGLAEGVALFLSWYRRSCSCGHAGQPHADAEEGIM